MTTLFVLIIILLLSFALTGWVRIYSLRKAILDIPNERSSHTMPTPRGGGIAITIAFFAGVSYLGWQDLIQLPLVKALLGGGLLIAATGYWDDLRSLSARIRFFLHFLAAAWVLYCVGGFPVLVLGTWQIHLGWIGSLIAAFGMVWLINLYNFMDGIDGIAGSEAIFVSIVAGIFFSLLGIQSIVLICFILAVATLGFLLWNWPPAKIFLGDVGSGLLGFIFAVLVLVSAQYHLSLLFSWLILLAYFVFDATFTLFHRVIRGERWYAAHRDHVYQRLIKKGMTHKTFVLWMLAVNLLILLPVFVLSIYKPNFAFVLFLLCGCLFAIFWWRVIVVSRTTDSKTASAKL